MAKISTVRTRKRGKTWSYIFEAGRKEDGRRKVVEKGGFPTREAAYEAGTLAFADWKHGNIGITSDAVTVKEFVESWLSNVAAVNVKPTTLSAYESIVRVRIIPNFTGIKVQDVNPGMIDKWIRKLYESGHAYNTLLKTLAVMRVILDYAVFPSELIASNPARYIKIPKSAPREVVKRSVIPVETLDRLLEKNPPGTQFHVPLLLLYHTGMRLGEVMGLSWDDLDLDGQILNVRKQILYARIQKATIFSTPKTRTSERYFYIDRELVERLREWKTMQEADERRQGGSYVCIYRTEEGKCLQQSKGIPLAVPAERVPVVCTQRNGRLVSREGLAIMLRGEGLNAHSFRHTHATQLIENGATPKGVASRLGQANATITQNLYTHNTKRLQRDTAAVFEKSMQTSYESRQNADKKHE